MSGLATLRAGLQDWLLGFDHDAALRMCGVSPGEPFGQPAGGSPPRLSFRISFLYASLLCFLTWGFRSSIRGTCLLTPFRVVDIFCQEARSSSCYFVGVYSVEIL